jgi:dihydroorotase
METSLTLTRPDDMHLHVRQGARMESVVPLTARQFGRAIIMPNTKPYISTVDDARRYRDEILAAVPTGISFEPLMTLYLQTTTSSDTIRAAKASGFIHGMKLYPAGKTTNSEGGVVDIWDVASQLRVMEEVDLPLLVHGESAKEGLDPFDREEVFYETAFVWLLREYPKLRIVAEHITTSIAARAVERAPRNARVAATVTPQHLLVNRAYMLDGMLRPHAYCKPILKREEDRESLVRMATSGNPRFFLGTDSAPHPKTGEARAAKEVDCGCAGSFTAHAALEMYAEVFEWACALPQLDHFASRYGAEFYELPRNEGTVTLTKEQWHAPETYDFGDATVVPFRQEAPLQWRIAN